MPNYLVKFYKTLLSSDGHPFKCLQHEVRVADAVTLAQAITCAQHEFETTSHAMDWRHQADAFEAVEQVPDLASPAPVATRHAAYLTLRRSAPRPRPAR